MLTLGSDVMNYRDVCLGMHYSTCFSSDIMNHEEGLIYCAVAVLYEPNRLVRVLIMVVPVMVAVEVSVVG